MVYATIDVLVLDALRHLQTVERNSTLRQYTSWIYHYNRSEVRFMIRTKNERDLKNCTDRRRGTIGDTYTAEQFRQIMFRVLPTWAAKAWNPRGTGPSQTLWRFLLLKVLTLLSYHSLLRGASIREITLPDIFLYRLASTSSVNPENQPVVMVIAARNSKASKDARLQQSYAARHLKVELCAVGETGLWLHFILDQIGQFHGIRLIPPVDTSTRASWYKKHLFFAKNDTDQGEPSTVSHQRCTRQLWDKNGVFCKRYVHAARAGGAQELAIDGTPRAEIAELGHWALDKMTRAVDDMLKTAEGKAAEGSDADKAAVHFWRTLAMLRRIVAEDLAVKLVRTPWHPYVQGSLLCRIPLFQQRAKRVDTETINKRRDPTQIQAEARRVPEAPPCATVQSPSEGGSADSANMGAGADGGDDKPPPPPQTDEEASYELNVVQPWREAKTVRDAWRLWNSITANDTRRLCDRIAEPGFIDRHTLLAGATQGALNKRVRRMLKVMDAVRQLRASDGKADTEAVVDTLHRIAASGIRTFADALTVLKPGTSPMLSKEAGMGVKGLGPKVVSKLRLACALVALNLKQSDWVETLFSDTWEEQMPKTKADLAKPTAPAKSTVPAKPTAPVHRPPTKRKKSA
ncbi:unnamed protein product [Closterium sp. NIES-65]|nr:unnamed protein product [Closterium sp. NIES-65]